MRFFFKNAVTLILEIMKNFQEEIILEYFSVQENTSNQKSVDFFKSCCSWFERFDSMIVKHNFLIVRNFKKFQEQIILAGGKVQNWLYKK